MQSRRVFRHGHIVVDPLAHVTQLSAPFATPVAHVAMASWQTPPPPAPGPDRPPPLPIGCGCANGHWPFCLRRMRVPHCSHGRKCNTVQGR